MFVDPEIFDLFYEELRKNFIEKELKNTLPVGMREDSPEIWLLMQEDTNGKKKYIAQFLLKETKYIDTKIFYKKRTEFRTNPNADLADQLFYNALMYIGVKVPNGVAHYSTLSLDEKLMILFHQFKSQVLKKLPALKKSTVNPDFENVTTIIEKYFDNISSKKYNEAWEALTEDCKNSMPWYGDLEKFKHSYANSNVFKDIHIFHHKWEANGSVISCNVYFEDRLKCNSSKEFQILNLLKLDDIDYFIKCINTIKNNLEIKGCNDLSGIHISTLFKPDASDYIWQATNFDTKKFDSLFDLSEILLVKKVFEAICRSENDTWRIAKIL